MPQEGITFKEAPPCPQGLWFSSPWRRWGSGPVDDKVHWCHSRGWYLENCLPGSRRTCWKASCWVLNWGASWGSSRIFWKGTHRHSAEHCWRVSTIECPSYCWVLQAMRASRQEHTKTGKKRLPFFFLQCSPSTILTKLNSEPAGKREMFIESNSIVTEKGKEGWINDVRDVRHKQNKQYSYYLT